MMLAFSSWQDFYSMGGYAFYVWLAAGVTLFTMLSMLILSILQRRALLREIRRHQYLINRRMLPDNASGSVIGEYTDE